MLKPNLSGTSVFPTSIHDYLPWDVYRCLPTNDLGLSIPYLNSPFHFRHHTAWHTDIMCY
jgi:hypothetical protein